MAVLAVKAERVAEFRRNIRRHLRSGQRRIHFTSESPQRRRAILAEIHTWPSVSVTVYTHPAGDIRVIRGHCLTAIANDATLGSASRLVIEREEADDQHDRRLLTELMRRADRSVRWDLLPPTAEPLLWAADAVAWCYSHPRPEWSRLVSPLINDIHRL